MAQGTDLGLYSPNRLEGDCLKIRVTPSLGSNEWAHKRLKKSHFVVLTRPQANDREDLRRFFKLFLEGVFSEVRMQDPE